VAIAVAFELDVGDFNEPGLVDVIFKLFETSLGPKKLSASDMEFGDLSGIENQSHFTMYN
jgi:hypothetical protein